MTKVLSGSEIEDILSSSFNNQIESLGNDYVQISNEKSLDLFNYLKIEQKYELLSSVTSVDRISHFEVVYHLTSLQKNESLVIKINCGEGRIDPKVKSVISVWRGAELQEREIYDLMGIMFEGHPNMKRLLLWENFEGHPLRKDFVS
ncbi:MAG: NADH-quinone oxidoreductase subunit C [Dehalococcoidia bacterium]|nr:NADH-quinone oxidoreductase subunit C [Dehalococcoidia bacterium]|tara:strand:+ start:3668 stop:4108 length:441 start_codon:yes stop_codon:yes gene_type:complete